MWLFLSTQWWLIVVTTVSVHVMIMMHVAVILYFPCIDKRHPEILIEKKCKEDISVPLLKWMVHVYFVFQWKRLNRVTVYFPIVNKEILFFLCFNNRILY